MPRSPARVIADQTGSEPVRNVERVPSPAKLSDDFLQLLVQELEASGPAARLLAADRSGGTSLTMAQTSYALAHELRQPLFTVALAAENLRLMLASDEPDGARMRQSVARIAEQVERAQAIIDQTLAHASGLQRERESADVVQAARKAEAAFETIPAAREIDFSWDLPADRLLVDVNPVELEQVFVNLMRNAIESVRDRRESGGSERGLVAITIEMDDDHVCCLVTDNGAGLVSPDEDAFFQPFFTTKASRGTGLGLHICRQIIGKAGGQIGIRNHAPQGAEVWIRIPLAGS